MKNLFKVLFFSFLIASSFISCSDDDSDDDGKVDNLAKIENFSATIVPQYSSKTYQYTWKGVSGAYSYQVFYRAKGSSDEWINSNVYIPNPNTPGQMMTHVMMAGYAKEVIYEIRIVAHRDTSDKIIAESDIITPEPLPLH